MLSGSVKIGFAGGVEIIYTALLNILQAPNKTSLDKAAGLVLLDNIAFRSPP